MVSVFLLVKGTNTPVFGLLLERLSMLLVVERNECALCVFLSLFFFKSVSDRLAAQVNI